MDEDHNESDKSDGVIGNERFSINDDDDRGS